jgi:hypothetical protein
MVRETGALWIIIPIIQSLFAIGLLAVGLLVGRGLLAARSWARWTAVGLSGVMVLGSIGLIVLIAVSANMIGGAEFTGQGQRPEMSPQEAEQMQSAMQGMFRGILVTYTMPPVATLALAITAIVALTRRRTGEWFSFAREVRLEHKRVREELS